MGYWRNGLRLLVATFVIVTYMIPNVGVIFFVIAVSIAAGLFTYHEKEERKDEARTDPS
jgi:hypothetical protein